jgi:hypothetical protein
MADGQALPTQLQAALAGGGLGGAGRDAAAPSLGLSPLAGGALNSSSLAPGVAPSVAPTGAPTGGQVGSGANVSTQGAAGAAGGGHPLAGLLGGLVGNLPQAQQGRFQTSWQSLDQAEPGAQLDFWSGLLGGGDANARILDAILKRGAS